VGTEKSGRKLFPKALIPLKRVLKRVPFIGVKRILKKWRKIISKR
jgi:hypothetical protein